MTTHEFKNDSDQAERRRVQRDTYLARAQAELDEAGGRFKGKTPSTIIHKNPASIYPRLPSSSPWAKPDPSGDEPPLGIDVNAVPDLGFHEARSTTNSGEVPVDAPLAVAASPIFLKRRV